MNMEFSILYAIQSIRTDLLDQVMLAVTSAAGSYGQIWPILGVILLLFKKTRRCGFAVLISYALVFLIGQYGLKDLIARPRPCHLDDTVRLLVEKPSSYSFPSTHTAWAFAAVTCLLMERRKCLGVLGLLAAIVIAFSRLYLFVHFPTDVAAGIVLGVICGFIAVKFVSIFKKDKKKSRKKKA